MTYYAFSEFSYTIYYSHKVRTFWAYLAYFLPSKIRRMLKITVLSKKLLRRESGDLSKVPLSKSAVHVKRKKTRFQKGKEIQDSFFPLILGTFSTMKPSWSIQKKETQRIGQLCCTVVVSTRNKVYA